MSKQLKVLHYAPGFNSGGIESRLLDWYRNMDRDNIKFYLIKLNNLDDTNNMQEFTKLGGEFYNLVPFSILSFFTFLKSLEKIFKNQSFDIVHVHDPFTGIFVLYYAKKAGIKCRILHSRTTDYLPNERNLQIKRVFKKISPILATNYFSCSYEAGIWGFGKKKNRSFEIIKNGIQLERFRFSNDIRNTIRNELNINNKFVIGSVSRLSTQKNILFLIQVFKELKKVENDSVLVIIGEGSMRETIEKRIKEYDIEDSVLLIGEKQNVWEYYMSFDVFISTSYYEGFGTTAIESQATGTPTVLSKGFPKSVVISNYVSRLDLNLDIKKWVKIIHEYKGHNYREMGIRNVIDYGFDAVQISKKLENFYRNFSN